MTPLARTGRHRQRYDDDRRRLVAGCIPYRVKQNVEDHTMHLAHRLEVLMISSPNRDDLVFPKGGWEDDETVHEAACREALEEAGVSGMIHVTEELDSWPEETCHKRRWLPVSEAKNLCRYPWMGEALENCVRFLNQVALHPSEPSLYVKPSEPQSLDSTRDGRIAAPLEAFC